MPKIQWTNLPRALRDHLFERLAERRITAEDLYQLKLWRESSPEAPEGPWFKDFGSFKICGEGKLPKTFLLRDSQQREKHFRVHRRRTPKTWRARRGAGVSCLVAGRFGRVREDAAGKGFQFGADDVGGKAGAEQGAVERGQFAFIE